LLLPPVIWSRVYLKKHTAAQAITGAILGFVLTAVALSLLLLYAPLNASI
jgi:membrane-associated phospholipid phosphatase